MASMMSILSDDGFSTQEIQILETLDTNFIENIFFEMDGGIFELK